MTVPDLTVDRQFLFLGVDVRRGLQTLAAALADNSGQRMLHRSTSNPEYVQSAQNAAREAAPSGRVSSW